MMEFVSWDDDIPNISGKIKKMFQTTNQKYIIDYNWYDGLTDLPIYSQRYMVLH